MESLPQAIVARAVSCHKQIEIIKVQQHESRFNLVTESDTVFFSPSFVGRMRCGSKFIDAKSTQPMAAYLGKGFPLVVDASPKFPLWIVHIHNDSRERLGADDAPANPMSFYKLHTGHDFLLASLVEQVVSGGAPDPLLQTFLHDLPKQMEPCSDLPASGNRRMAETLRQRILETEDRQINLQEVAGEMGCHPSQLSREFRRQFGIAPYKFSFLLRLAKTREWLRRGQNLADVALNFEFSDQSHFTRAFRQIYKMTPNHYRNLYRDQWELRDRA